MAMSECIICGKPTGFFDKRNAEGYICKECADCIPSVIDCTACGTEKLKYFRKLSLKEMAERMSECNVFVMPSAIENHSSTLIEAMMVGTPCVSSYVGGVSDYLRHGENGFLYRFDEPETLAGYVMKLFDDRTLAATIGDNAKNSSRSERLSINIAEDFVNAYSSILG